MLLLLPLLMVHACGAVADCASWYQCMLLLHRMLLLLLEPTSTYSQLMCTHDMNTR